MIAKSRSYLDEMIAYNQANRAWEREGFPGPWVTPNPTRDALVATHAAYVKACGLKGSK